MAANAAQSLVDILRRLGLEANPSKTKVMAYLPGSIRTGLSDAAYHRRLTGEGFTHREWQQLRTTCSQCGKDIGQSSLTQHLRQQHGMEPPANWNVNNIVTAQLDPQHYTVNFPANEIDCACPVGNCEAILTTRAGLRYHFHRRHWNDTIHIQEESIAPLPKCPRCGLQTRLLNNRHYNSDTCREGVARRAQRLAELRAYEADTATFSLNNAPLDKVTTFLYLGRIMAYNNSDWPTLYRNLKKAQKRWAMVVRVLDKEGAASTRARGFFYKTIVQSVLLYSCETWALTKTMLNVLESVHHRVARRITGKMARKVNGEWIYPPLEEAMKDAGLHSIQHYVAKRQNHMANHISTRPNK